MGAAFFRHTARRVTLGLSTLCLITATGACQPAPTTFPERPARDAAARHPIQPTEPWVTVPVAGSDSNDAARVTPGPNSRTSRTPDMAPRVEPADRVQPTSPEGQIDDIRRELQQQRERVLQKTDPPKGTIKRPGIIKPPGILDVPR